MRAAAAVVMQVFGDIGELGKEAERPHHRNGRVVVEAAENRLQRLLGIGIAVAMESDRSLADVLDQLEAPVPQLLAQRIAEQAPEQTDVLAQRPVFFQFLFGGGIQDKKLLWPVARSGPGRRKHVAPLHRSATAAAMYNTLFIWRPLRDSNSCYRRERAMS